MERPGDKPRNFRLADKSGDRRSHTEDGYTPPPPPFKKGYVPPPPPPAPKQPPQKQK